MVNSWMVTISSDGAYVLNIVLLKHTKTRNSKFIPDTEVKSQVAFIIFQYSLIY